PDQDFELTLKDLTKPQGIESQSPQKDIVGTSLSQVLRSIIDDNDGLALNDFLDDQITARKIKKYFKAWLTYAVYHDKDNIVSCLLSRISSDNYETTKLEDDDLNKLFKMCAKKLKELTGQDKTRAENTFKALLIGTSKQIEKGIPQSIQGVVDDDG